jgi:hypothetical protein
MDAPTRSVPVYPYTLAASSSQAWPLILCPCLFAHSVSMYPCKLAASSSLAWPSPLGRRILGKINTLARYLTVSISMLNFHPTQNAGKTRKRLGRTGSWQTFQMLFRRVDECALDTRGTSASWSCWRVGSSHTRGSDPLSTSCLPYRVPGLVVARGLHPSTF